MSTLKLKEAMQLVLCYYSENDYSNLRKLEAEKTLKKLEEILSLETCCHDMESIETFIKQQDLSYNEGCDLSHFASKVFCAMETGAFSNSTVRRLKPSLLNSVEYMLELECYIPLLKKQGRALSTVNFEMWANRELLDLLLFQRCIC